MEQRYLSRSNVVSAILLLIAFIFGLHSLDAHAQVVTILANLGLPSGPFVQGTDGNFYSESDLGAGGMFKMTPDGTVTTLYGFCSQRNCHSDPLGGLILGKDGAFYGTTSDTTAGGKNGTIFRMTSKGSLTILHDFCRPNNCRDGDEPVAGLSFGINGNLYGTATYGGLYNLGTVFEFSLKGALKTLYSFCSQANCNDGAVPRNKLVQGTDGNFYGTTSGGGRYGTIFKLTPAGTLTTLHLFTGTDGALGYGGGGLVQATDGNFYGVTGAGGAFNGGTIFEISPTGQLTTLYNFCALPGCVDGFSPTGGLIQATDGNFYGTTSAGGLNGTFGTIFQMSPSGTLTTFYSFNGNDGWGPAHALLQATDGQLYGSTEMGGSGINQAGTAFSIALGLPPFVAFVSDSGKISERVEILGQGFTGTTAVLFDGISAHFTVISGTFLTATVPSGASTGSVTVNTPSGVLQSNVPLRVRF